MSEEFSPLLAFCNMHHDKLIDGSNSFGPSGVGLKCTAFLWSKINIPIYRYPFKADNSIIAKTTSEEITGPEFIDLKRVDGSSQGYYLYVLRGKNEK